MSRIPRIVIEECHACGASDCLGVEHTVHGGPQHGEVLILCELCYTSPTGYEATHPTLRRTASDVLRAVGVSYNLLAKMLAGPVQWETRTAKDGTPELDALLSDGWEPVSMVSAPSPGPYKADLVWALRRPRSAPEI